MTGTVGILNVGAGDTKLSFDPANPAERIRASRIVRDMLRRGYALLVEVDQPDGTKAYQRALDFREDSAEYIIADFDPLASGIDDGPSFDRNEDAQEPEGSANGPAKPSAATRSTRSRGRARKAIPAASVRAVAVARTAGG
ncbi:MAG TPA: hypothetical protein VNF04_04320 [Stellaceae bacterium]|nr:hypothetical protein [Stellaceae bacterium]